ncbi:hypothetical protein HY991_03705 [Candidatus Micrarchaeota archaeon]|nr:hypothetical protein [Candidatus Micrarchaeota archaeon]
MSFRKKFRDFSRIYRMTHAFRRDWLSWKWRVFIILLTILVVVTVYQYLLVTYTGNASTVGHPESFSIPEKLFNWFMTGFLIGAVAVALIIEGEFLLGVRRVAKALYREEKKAGKKIEKGVKKLEKEIQVPLWRRKRK